MKHLIGSESHRWLLSEEFSAAGGYAPTTDTLPHPVVASVQRPIPELDEAGATLLGQPQGLVPVEFERLKCETHDVWGPTMACWYHRPEGSFRRLAAM